MKKSISNRHYSIIVLFIILAPLFIHTMDAIFLFMQMDLNLINKLYAGFGSLVLFSLLFKHIIYGQIVSISKLVVTAYFLFLISLSVSLGTFNDVVNVSWTKVILTIFFSAIIAWIIGYFVLLIKTEIEEETRNKEDSLDQEKSEKFNKAQTEDRDDYSEIIAQRDRYWKTMEEFRTAYMECLKKELNSKTKYCPQCNSSLASNKNKSKFKNGLA